MRIAKRFIYIFEALIIGQTRWNVRFGEIRLASLQRETPVRFWKTESCHASRDQLSWIQDRCCPRYRVRCSGDSHRSLAPIFSSVDFSSPVRAGERLCREQVRACKGTSENRYLLQGKRERERDINSWNCFAVTVLRGFRILSDLENNCCQRRGKEYIAQVEIIASILLFSLQKLRCGWTRHSVFLCQDFYEIENIFYQSRNCC